MVHRPPSPSQGPPEKSHDASSPKHAKPAAQGPHHEEPHHKLHDHPHARHGHSRGHTHTPKRKWNLVNRDVLVRIAGLCIASVVGIGGGLALKSYLMGAEEVDVYGLEGKVQRLCQFKLDDLDCECLWERAGDAFTFENTANILDVLAERRRWTGQITRARIKRFSDERSASLISRALYHCTLLF